MTRQQATRNKAPLPFVLSGVSQSKDLPPPLVLRLSKDDAGHRPGTKAMKITRVRWAPYRIPFRTPYQTSRGTATHREGAIVWLEDDYGFEGLGEASLDPSADQPALGSLPIYFEFAARSIAGKEDEEIDEALDSYLSGDAASRAAHCALETAVFDASCREIGVSLAQLLTGEPGSPPALRPAHPSVQVNALVAQARVQEAVDAAMAAVRDGFGSIKLKVGMESTTEREVERVKAIRHAIGRGVKLRLDANEAWEEAQAIERIRALEQFDIELVEQPVAADALHALARVAGAVRTPLAADEGAASAEAAVSALAHGIRLVLKPMRLGGATVTRPLAEMALRSRLPCIVTTTIDTGIGTALALQVAASLPGAALAHGLATLELLEDDLILEPGLPIENGRMRVPDAPGLGVTLDEEALMRYSDGWREVSL